MSYRHIEVSQAEGVCRVALNQPERMNALGMGPGSNRDELLRALAAADADDAVGCLVIAANGSAFCGGGDLSGNKPRETAYEDWRFHADAEAFHAALRGLRKPLVAAVNGLCLGAGLGLIAQCDLVVAASDARFGLVEGRIGLSGASSIVHLVGSSWAKFLILTGEVISAVRAERIGLVFVVVPQDELRARVQDLGARIARLPREAVQLNKAAIDKVVDAAGLAAAREVASAVDPVITSAGRTATAPDGRLFRDILRSEGVPGLKKARELQYTTNWLE